MYKRKIKAAFLVAVFSVLVAAAPFAAFAAAEDAPETGYESSVDAIAPPQLTGAKLAIYRQGDQTPLHVWTSTEKPYAIRALPAGEYVLREIDVPAGHKKAADIFFVVKVTKDIQTITMVDEKIPTTTDGGGEKFPGHSSVTGDAVRWAFALLLAALIAAAGLWKLKNTYEEEVYSDKED
jgi:hypothetical protein